MSQNKISSPRRKSVGVRVGAITIGGDAPVVVQSMTNTDTADEVATAIQVAQLARAGSELVRILSIPQKLRARCPRYVKIDDMGGDNPPVGFYFNGHKLLTAYPDCAKALASIVSIRVMSAMASVMSNCHVDRDGIKNDKPVRIGVNWGSLDPEMLARIMDENACSPEPMDAGFVMRKR